MNLFIMSLRILAKSLVKFSATYVPRWLALIATWLPPALALPLLASGSGGSSRFKSIQQISRVAMDC